MKDSNHLEPMTKLRRQRQVLTNLWIISSLQWTMKCHSVVGFINWKMSGYSQENHLMTDELMECLRVLADCCNFPTDDEKECNVHYHFVRALSDKDLVKKLLALDLKATTAKMLEVCWTHIAISDNLDALGLVGSKPIKCHSSREAQQAMSKWSKTTWKPTPMSELHEVTST